jgi:hypothetical protein
MMFFIDHQENGKGIVSKSLQWRDCESQAVISVTLPLSLDSQRVRYSDAWIRTDNVFLFLFSDD